MRKDNATMVSVNPKYGIEVCTLGQLADSVKEDDPVLCNILTIIMASILANDEENLVKYCNKYLENKVYESNLKDQLNKMLDDHINGKLPDDPTSLDGWYF
jgi:hypothetical protein